MIKHKHTFAAGEEIVASTTDRIVSDPSAIVAGESGRDDNNNNNRLRQLRQLIMHMQTRLRNYALFLQLFTRGIIETTITHLLKLSRDYRYVAHVLAAEKCAQKRSAEAAEQVSVEWSRGLVENEMSGAGKTAPAANNQ
jgi:hypothetical protein